MRLILLGKKLIKYSIQMADWGLKIFQFQNDITYFKSGCKIRSLGLYLFVVSNLIVKLA